jgi:hypothetical protein
MLGFALLTPTYGLAFIGVEDVDRGSLDASIEYCAFDN